MLLAYVQNASPVSPAGSFCQLWPPGFSAILNHIAQARTLSALCMMAGEKFSLLIKRSTFMITNKQVYHLAPVIQKMCYLQANWQIRPEKRPALSLIPPAGPLYLLEVRVCEQPSANLAVPAQQGW